MGSSMVEVLAQMGAGSLTFDHICETKSRGLGGVFCYVHMLRFLPTRLFYVWIQHADDLNLVHLPLFK